MGQIYLVINNINKKCYVGKTMFSGEERWKSHLLDSKKDGSDSRPLYRAINKYGKDNFSLEILEEVEEEELLSEREKYWIAFYDGYYKGYNATYGGDGKCLYNHQEIVDLIQEGCSVSKIVEKIGCCRDTVYDIAKHYKIKVAHEDKKNTTIVKQYDKQDNYLNTFNSIADAARWLIENNKASSNNESGIRSHISANTKNKRKSAYGFVWKI